MYTEVLCIEEYLDVRSLLSVFFINNFLAINRWIAPKIPCIFPFMKPVGSFHETELVPVIYTSIINIKVTLSA